MKVQLRRELTGHPYWPSLPGAVSWFLPLHSTFTIVVCTFFFLSILWLPLLICFSFLPSFLPFLFFPFLIFHLTWDLTQLPIPAIMSEQLVPYYWQESQHVRKLFLCHEAMAGDTRKACRAPELPSHFPTSSLPLSPLPCPLQQQGGCLIPAQVALAPAGHQDLLIQGR